MAKPAQDTAQSTMGSSLIKNWAGFRVIALLSASVAGLFFVWYLATPAPTPKQVINTPQHGNRLNDRDQPPKLASIANDKSAWKMKSTTTSPFLVAEAWKRLWPGTNGTDSSETLELLKRGGGVQLRKQADEGDAEAALQLVRYGEVCLAHDDSISPFPGDARPDVKKLSCRDFLPYFGDDVRDLNRLKSLALVWMQTVASSGLDLAAVGYFQMISELIDKGGFVAETGAPTLGEHLTYAMFLLTAGAERGSFFAAHELMNAYDIGRIVGKNAELASRYAKIATRDPTLASRPRVQKLAKLD